MEQPGEQLGEQPRGRQKHPRPQISLKIPPRSGITLLPLKPDHYDEPYGVMWRAQREDGTPWRPSAFFRTIELLEKKVSELLAARKAGNVGLVPTAAEVAEWRAFKKLIGAASPFDVYTGWKQWLESKGKVVCTTTVAQAVDDFLKKQAKRVERRKLDKGSYGQKKAKLNRFKVAFASCKLDEVSTDDLEEWLDDLNDDEVVVAPTTRDGYIKKVSELFEAYKKEVPENPAAALELSEEYGSPGGKVLRPEKIATLFKVALQTQPHIIPRLACEFYVGLRFASAAKVERSDFIVEERVVNLAAGKMKGRVSHDLRGHGIDAAPSCLWDWLTHKINNQALIDDPKCWTMTKSRYMHAKSALFDAAKIENPHNTARHAFCTFHIKAFRNPGLTALILAHRNQDRLWQTYRHVRYADDKVITRDDAQLYFSISPKTVDRVAAGKALQKTELVELPELFIGVRPTEADKE